MHCSSAAFFVAIFLMQTTEVVQLQLLKWITGKKFQLWSTAQIKWAISLFYYLERCVMWIPILLDNGFSCTILSVLKCYHFPFIGTRVVENIRIVFKFQVKAVKLWLQTGLVTLTNINKIVLACYYFCDFFWLLVFWTLTQAIEKGLCSVGSLLWPFILQSQEELLMMVQRPLS